MFSRDTSPISMKKIFPILIFIFLIISSYVIPHFSYAFFKKASPSLLKEAMYYTKLDNNTVQCGLCPRRCVIPDGKRGFCRVRENRGGVLYTLVYAKPAAIHVDPIEKKPLFHVYPDSKSFSIATAGCNLACKFCQNWQISQASPEDIPVDTMEPQAIVNAAKSAGCETIAYTYTEPTIFYEYMFDIAALSRKAGIKNVMHSSGFINEEPLRALCKYLDAANIDLKGPEEFYQQICLGTRNDVLRTLKILKEEGVWLEITYLVVPTLNDDVAYARDTCNWIKENLGADVPLHISRFWPTYKLTNLSPTSVETLEKIRQVALDSGLRYVYIGNVPGNKSENTYCPKCKKPVIERTGYTILSYEIENGKCKYCGEKIEGIWRKEAQESQKPAVAGMFYPDNPDKLKKMVDGFINKADLKPVEGEIMAIISPHAGYEYSGWVAGYAFKTVKNKKFDTVIIVGLSHRAAFKGLTVLDKDFYQTPLGSVSIDKDITKKLIAYNKDIKYDASVFAEEHSAEAEIPFVQEALPGSKIVVILTGDFNYETGLLLRDALVSAVKSGTKKVLLIASTDMSHFYSDQKARDIDKNTINEMEKFDPEGFFEGCLSSSGRDSPCGSIGVLGVMMAARQLGSDKLKVLKYATSADTTFDKTRVVGYCSAVIYKEDKMESLLNQAQKKRLLEIARKAIEDYLDKGEVLKLKEEDPVLNKKMGAFVTLHKSGELRGCIGNMVGKGPLYLTIQDMAIAAATQDPRFPSVTKGELKDTDIEISVLSPMLKVRDPSEIEMGKHGVMVQSGFRSGVFLPQVATETGWDKETFMNNLCVHKAGLSADAWKKGKCEMFIFTAEVFGEK